MAQHYLLITQVKGRANNIELTCPAKRREGWG